MLYERIKTSEMTQIEWTTEIYPTLVPPRECGKSYNEWGVHIIHCCTKTSQGCIIL